MNFRCLLLIAAGVMLASSLWGQNPVPRVQARITPVASNVVEGNLYVVSNTSLPAVTFVMDWGDGSKTTNVVSWPLFSHDYANGSIVAISYTNQLTALQQSGTSVSKKEVAIVIPQSPVSDFTGTPTTGVPPLAVLFTNLSSGTYTNATWNFGVLTNGGSAFTTQTLARSVSVTFGADASDFRTNSVSLTVAGYGTSLLTKTNYITAVAAKDQYALIFNGPGDPAVAYTVDADPMWTTPPYSVSVWINPGGISDSLRHVAGTGAVGEPGGQYDWSWRFEGGPHGDGTGEAIWAGYATGFAGAVWPDYSAWVKLEWRVSADGTVVSNFVNDVFCSASDTGAFAYETPRRFAIGNSGESSPGNNSFGGVITDVCFYTNNGVLAARWDMTTEGGTGTNVVDVIGGKNLIIYGGAIWTNIVTHP